VLLVSIYTIDFKNIILCYIVLILFEAFWADYDDNC